MNLVDLLIELKVPAWLVLIIIGGSFIAIAYYKFLLDLKLKKLDQSLKEEVIKREKILELVQERFRKRLNALDKINRFLMEFHHAVMHIKNGDENYSKNIERYYKEIRNLSRQYELDLGNKFYEIIISLTDKGKKVINPDIFDYDEYLDEEYKLKCLIDELQSTLPGLN